jgi:hypothetical protein
MALPDDVEELGYVKYSGESLREGIIDAGSAGSALVGLDEAMRFFNTQQSPDFATLAYDIPVQTRAGSWEAVVLAGTAVVGAFALGYAKKAGEKLAENDFKDVGLKHALKKSLLAIQTLARLVKHTRRTRNWKVDWIEPTGSIETAVISNTQGEEIHVPIQYLRWYENMPARLLVRLTSVVRTDRVLTIGVLDAPGPREVTIFEEDRPLFEDPEIDEPDDEVLFPELVHGADVELVGRMTRGNEGSNSVGFEYEGHILNCVPASGSIRQYKPALFLRCKVSGQVTRQSKSRFVADRRPTIILRSVIPLERDGQLGLFGSVAG